MKRNDEDLTPEEILDQLVSDLSEYNRLVKLLNQEEQARHEKFRKLGKFLMFGRLKDQNDD